ncbi:TIGR03986 family CRISPR-associated RAMP protein [candidate division KSB1 bacterium]|nr:TIGR03986 family CRISPR-associated RAMP protein [candidate division KSB1 bacterium]
MTKFVWRFKPIIISTICQMVWRPMLIAGLWILSSVRRIMMENERKPAKLKVRLSNRGKRVADLIIPDEPHPRNLPGMILDDFAVDSEYDVTFIFELIQYKGVKKHLTIFKNNQVIYDSHPDVPKSSEKETEMKMEDRDFDVFNDISKHKDMSSTRENDKANAPYNFVPLNRDVLNSDLSVFQDKFHPDKKSGFIELTVKPKTPIFIRAADTVEEYREKQKTNKPINSDFFNINGSKCIPGSSLRGMVRTLFEIVTWSKLSFVENNDLYFRSFKDKSKQLQQKYNNKIIYGPIITRHGTKLDIKIKFKFAAGYLFRNKNSNYIIKPAREHPGDKFSFYRAHKNDVSAMRNYEHVYFQVKPVYPTKDSKHWYKSQSGSNHKVDLYVECAMIDKISSTNSPGFRSGTLVKSGMMNNKHWQWVLNEPVSNTKQYLTVSPDVIKSYQDDSDRDEEWDVLKQIANGSNGIPVFYILNSKGEVQEFGHTGYFRVKYDNAIHDHISHSLDNDDINDMTSNLFGSINDDGSASRLAFEDLIARKTSDEGECIPSILGTPKPTSFQLYLEQTKSEGQWVDYNTYNPSENAPIRGYKLYWHKNNESWQLEKIGKQLADLLKKKWSKFIDDERTFDSFTPDEQKQILDIIKNDEKEKHHTVINPVKSGEFKGRIRFDNLSPVELGALLFVLDLPENHFHKIGMGKPLGLGSVEIDTNLVLDEKTTRYNEFAFGWFDIKNSGSKDDQQNKALSYKKDFAAFLLNEAKEDGDILNKLWNSPRLKELKKMLEWPSDENSQNWNSKRYYPKVESSDSQFRKRLVLPKPSDV